MIGFAVLLAVATAHAEEPVELSGFVSPGFAIIVRPNGVPEDRLSAGLSGSRAGVVFAGNPLDHWSFKTYLLVGGDSVDVLTAVSQTDLDSDGVPDSIESSTATVAREIVRETSVTWSPRSAFGIRLGRMPIPFTSQAQTADTALLFSSRAGPAEVFVSDDDLGGLVEFDLGEGIFLASGGLFNGTGLGAGAGDALGVLYMARMDLQPLGSFGFDETRSGSGSDVGLPFRIGVGGGVIYHPYTTWDSAGYADVSVADFRGSASARAAIGGFSVATEILYRYQEDSLTHRPVEASGTYGQVGWLLPMGVEPIFRLGHVTEDMSFDPRLTNWAEAGMNYYPNYRSGDIPDAVRFTLQLLSENRVTERDLARGIATQIQMKW